MKVEKINENKLRIILTLEELENRQISIKDIEKDPSIAKNLFIDLIEESNLGEDFMVGDFQLLIEASSDNSNIFVVTITKVDSIPELKKYALMDNSENRKRRKSNATTNLSFFVDGNIFTFNTLDELLDLCDISKKEKLFCGKNSLYKYKNKYFLIFSKTAIKNKRFIKTFVFLTEYCSEYYLYDIFETSVKEKGNLMIENNAMQTLKKI